MRQSLFEQLKNKQLSYLDEVIKFYGIIYNGQDRITSTVFRQFFFKSCFAIFYKDFDSAFLCLFENKSGIKYNSITSAFKYSDSITLDSFLNYLEFLYTLMSLFTGFQKNSDYEHLMRMIEHDSKVLGYHFIFDKNNNYYKVAINNELAESVALHVSESARDKIYNYLTLREGEVENKRVCIKSLADDIELLCKKYSSIKEYEKTKQFIQCARHTKDNPNKSFSFYYDDEEKWLDVLFEMIIGILSFSRTKELTKLIIGKEGTN